MKGGEKKVEKREMEPTETQVDIVFMIFFFFSYFSPSSPGRGRRLWAADSALEPGVIESEPRERPLPVSLLQPPAGPWMLSLATSWCSISCKDSPAAAARGARWARDSEALAP